MTVWKSTGGLVRRAEWPNGPRFYAHGRRKHVYFGAFGTLEEAVAAIVSADIIETPRQRRDRIVSRAIETLTQIPASVRRGLLDDSDDPIPSFFARFGVVPYAAELATIYATSKRTIQDAEHAGAAKVRKSRSARDAYESAMSREPTWWEILGGMADA